MKAAVPASFPPQHTWEREDRSSELELSPGAQAPREVLRREVGRKRRSS